MSAARPPSPDLRAARLAAALRANLKRRKDAPAAGEPATSPDPASDAVRRLGDGAGEG